MATDSMEHFSQDDFIATVLIVDDNIKNVQVLGTILMERKYRVAVATQGTVVFELVHKVKPDLILLDIMLPDIDGFEVCNRLKSEPTTADIPVLFLSARTEADDIVRGFDLGGSDYITKPFRTKELLARVKTHITLTRLQKILRKKNEDLETALANVKTLQGLLPICSYCKKIRDDQGFWNQIETYFHEHSHIDFTHSMCPDCMQQHFPEHSSKTEPTP